MFFAKKSKNTLRLRPATSYKTVEHVEPIVAKEESKPEIEKEDEEHLIIDDKPKSNKMKKNRNIPEIQDEVSIINNADEKI